MLKFKNISEVINDKYFISIIIVLFLMYIGAIFLAPFAFISAAMLCVCAVFLNFKNFLIVFLFSYPFECAMYVTFNSRSANLFLYAITFIVFVCVLKYLMQILKNQQKINWKILVPFLVFLFYLILPINKISLIDTSEYIIAILLIYLIAETKEELKLKELIIYAAAGLILASIISYLLNYSNRLEEFVPDLNYYGLHRFCGLLTNPNAYAILSVFITACLMYYCIFKNDFKLFIFLIPILFFSYLTLSRNFMFSTFIIMGVYIIFSLIKRKSYIFFNLILTLILFCLVALSLPKYTEVYTYRVEGTVVEVTQEKNENSVNEGKDPENTWVDGTEIDPGRIGIWKRYLNDYTSSAKTILFGRGVSAEALGVGAHNFYIKFLWHFGIIGVLIFAYAIINLLVKKLKNFKCPLLYSLMFVMIFIASIEEVFFERSFMVFIVLFLVLIGERHESINNSSNIQS